MAPHTSRTIYGLTIYGLEARDMSSINHCSFHILLAVIILTLHPSLFGGV